MKLVVLVPIATVPPNRQRVHHFARARQVAAERDATRMVLVDAKNRYGWRPALPCTVTLTRLSRGTLDCDSLPGACKGVRDEVAVALGLPLAKLRPGQTRPVADDRDPRVSWAYGPEKGPAGVRITVEPREV